MLSKKKILLFADWFEPGYRAGGPIRSTVNFAQNMKDDYDIYVFTSDRDLDAKGPYDQISQNEWLTMSSGVQCYYCSPDHQTRDNIRQQISILSPDFIYLNSMFSTWFTIMPLLVARKHRFTGKIVLTPRGMLRKSALSFKPLKKQLFLFLFKILGFPPRIYFQATDDTEAQDIRKYFGSRISMMQISNFPAVINAAPLPIEKIPGTLQIIFVGRIHPIKNLYFLLEAIRKAFANIHLTIVGSMEDAAYWQQCETLIREFPKNITTKYVGEIPNQELPKYLSAQHIFALPTMGENFGHAIFEALAHGKPVLISDQTPWRQLTAKQAGWDLPLNSPELFSEAIRFAAAFDQQTYNDWSAKSWQFAHDFTRSVNIKQEYLKLFN